MIRDTNTDRDFCGKLEGKVITDVPAPLTQARIRDIYVVIFGLRIYLCLSELTKGGGTMHATLITNSMRSYDISPRMGISIWIGKTIIKTSSTICNFIQNYIILLHFFFARSFRDLTQIINKTFLLIKKGCYTIGWVNTERNRGYSLQVAAHPCRAAQFAYPPRLCPLCPKHAIKSAPPQLSTVSYVNVGREPYSPRDVESERGERERKKGKEKREKRRKKAR